MAPDLNSLPPSTTNSPPQAVTASDSPSPLSSITPTATSATRATMQAVSTQVPLHRHNGEPPLSPSPRSASISLQAAATLNAGLQRVEISRPSSQSPSSLNRQSPTAGRRRSQVIMNLQMADPSVPSPGEMVTDTQPSAGHLRNASPHMNIPGTPPMIPSHWDRDPLHNRTPSLGELHQELENEQEFQVNRLLQEIRRLQVQVQRQQSTPGQTSAVAVDDASDRSVATTLTGSTPQSAHPSLPTGSVPRSPGLPVLPRSSFDMARADLHRRSRTPSRGASPRLRSTSISGDSGEHWVLGGRDESAFYQAETQMLTRENQMLRHRIRDLERQLSELSGTASTSSTHEPSLASHLHRSTSISEEEATRPTHLVSSSLPTVEDTPKEE